MVKQQKVFLPSANDGAIGKKAVFMVLPRLHARHKGDFCQLFHLCDQPGINQAFQKIVPSKEYWVDVLLLC